MWQDVKMLNLISSILLGVVTLALLISAIWWVAQRPVFALKTIQIEAAGQNELRRINRLIVRTNALAQIKGNFFTTDLDKVRIAFEALPWVRKATIKRQWPNTLIVKIEEHQPLATWDEDGRLLSVRGDLFTANLDEAEEDGDLLRLSGPNGSEKDVLIRLADFRRWLAPIKLRPSEVILSSRYAWTIKLSNGMTVQLGREQNQRTLQERIARLVQIYPSLLAHLQSRIESVDMRYPNGIAVKLTGLSSASGSNKK